MKLSFVKKAEAELKAKLAYQDLNAALELASESEQQLATERKRFQERLNELLAKTAEEPIEKRNAKRPRSRFAQDSIVELDEQATRHIIDSQLREAGWEVDSQTLRHSKGTRPAKGRNIAIAEWPTKNGPADYVLFVGLRPVATIEAKKFKVSVPVALIKLPATRKGSKLS